MSTGNARTPGEPAGASKATSNLQGATPAESAQMAFTQSNDPSPLNHPLSVILKNQSFLLQLRLHFGLALLQDLDALLLQQMQLAVFRPAIGCSLLLCCLFVDE